MSTAAIIGAAPGFHAPAPREGAPEIEVISSEFGFDPAELRIEAGRPVNVSLVNEGDLLQT